MSLVGLLPGELAMGDVLGNGGIGAVVLVPLSSDLRAPPCASRKCRLASARGNMRCEAVCKCAGCAVHKRDVYFVYFV